MKTHTFVKSISVAALFVMANCTGASSTPVKKPKPKPDTRPIVEKTLAEVGIDGAAIDKSVNPCDDFYRYACGSWLASTEIPADRSRWSRTFSVIDERNKLELRRILEDAAANKKPADEITAKLGAFYGACMDEKAIDAQGVKPIKPLLALAKKAKDVPTVAAAIFELHKHGIWALFSLQAEQDFKNSTQVVAYLDQAGLGLPDKDYYLVDDDKSRAIRDAYVAHVERMLVLTGMSKAQAKTAAGDVLTIETELAKVSLSKVEQRDPATIYNKIDRDGVLALTPTFPWDGYFQALAHPDIKDIVVASPKFFEGMAALFDSVQPAAWQAYLQFHIVRATAPTLGKKFVNEAFAMTQVLSGQPKLEERWKRCITATDRALGELLGQGYVATMFAGDSKPYGERMVKEITKAFGKNAGTLAWMDAKTRARALEKLGTLVFKIGYPSKWKTYPFAVDRKSHAANVLAGAAWKLQDSLDDIGKPLDREEWGITPQTVNAYYNPLMNEMVFPAGILQPPFYSAAFADAVNLGAMGWVVGHELTHGFDDQGAQFAADGNLKVWWEPAVAKSFKAKTACVVKQYAAYKPLPDLNLNGELTLGENIADIGGVKFAFAAYRAMRKDAKERIVAEGYSEDQLFFLSAGQAWCNKSREEITRQLVQVDPHSPGEFRVNGALQDNPTFATAFKCAAGTPMAPKNRCVVW